MNDILTKYGDTLLAVIDFCDSNDYKVNVVHKNMDCRPISVAIDTENKSLAIIVCTNIFD